MNPGHVYCDVHGDIDLSKQFTQPDRNFACMLSFQLCTIWRTSWKQSQKFGAAMSVYLRQPRIASKRVLDMKGAKVNGTPLKHVVVPGGDVQHDNLPMLGLARSLGHRTIEHPSDATLRRVVIDASGARHAKSTQVSDETIAGPRRNDSATLAREHRLLSFQ